MEKMPSSQTVGMLERPPIVKSDSSSSSLSGMQQAVPSFQSFIRRTPPLDNQKPLPPPPMVRRASSSPPPRSRTPSLFASRRSSSVYSRTVSQWGPDDISWKSADLADEPLPPLPTLLPLAYSASTPQLVEKQPQPHLLQVRTHIPLIITPSPTASRTTSSSPPATHNPSILLPTPPASVKVPRKHLRTVSLEKANEVVHSPGAVHLLPEELRAQKFVRSRSHEPMRISSIDVIAGKTPSHPIEPPTLVDNQGRQRAIHTPLETLGSVTNYPFPVASPKAESMVGSFRIGKGPERQMAPLASQQRKASRDKVAQAFGIGETDEPRGRRRRRGPRNMEYSHYLPNRRTSGDSSSSEGGTDPQRIAKEYHSLLTEQYRAQSGSPRYPPTDSDDNIRAHMKMVPKPLFQNKPPARLPGSMRERLTDTSISPYRLSSDSEMNDNVENLSIGSSRSSGPFQLSLTPDSMHRRRSTSGTIPISPPTDASPRYVEPSPRRLPEKQKTTHKKRRKANITRVSAYYPHVAHRKGKQSKRRSSKAGSETPPLPLLSADIIAQRHSTSEETEHSSPPIPLPYESMIRGGYARIPVDGSSTKAHQPLYQRVAKGAAKYADLLTKPSELPERHNCQATSAATVASGSPHLSPSPVKKQPKQIHLGWSESAKSAFEDSRLLILSPKKVASPSEAARTPQFSHVAGPARPLDERNAEVVRPGAPRRNSSIFGAMLESWKEIRAEKRREELKKVIRVVPQGEGNRGEIKRRSSAFGWM